ncbi:hypothetical protein [Sagittula sp.]|uniref:hypothetical protein n=1 Tax=Sagittula sp. TaxID=2038081 RepID=UPI00351216A9
MSTPINHTDALRAEIEAKALELSLSPSTIGRMAGQGGKFYERLLKGKRVWPETVTAVRSKLQEMKAPSEGAPSAEAAE